MKRFLSLLLVCCFIILALAACGKEDPEATESSTESGSAAASNKPTEKPRGTTTETDTYGQNKLISAVPVDDLDYTGQELVIAIRDGSDIYREFGRKEGEAYDQEDATLDEAIATRNDIVQSGLGLTITMEYIKHDGYDDGVTKFDTLIRSEIMNEQHLYDIAVNAAYPAVNPNIRGFLANLADTDKFPYFDFELPCWNQAIYKNTYINNKIYAVAGDLTLTLFDYATVMWCNYDLYKANKTEEDPEDLQQYAIDGDWIYDDLYRWSQVNENSDASTDCGDLHGFAVTFNFFDSLLLAWDIDLVDTDKQTGRHSFNVKENEKAQGALDIVNIIKEQVGVADYYSQGTTPQICTCNKGGVGHFTEGDYVFKSDKIYWGATANLKLREMDDSYILLPIPKWDGDQPEYGTTSADTYNLITVIDHSANIDEPLLGEQISAYLQYATEQSYTDVRKYYFERIIKAKTLSPNEETAEKSKIIFDRIVDNLEFNTETIYSTNLLDICWLWRDIILRGDGLTLANAFMSNDFSGGGARNEQGYMDAIANFDKWLYDELEEE